MGQKERLIAFCESMGMKKAEFERLPISQMGMSIN